MNDFLRKHFINVFLAMFALLFLSQCAQSCRMSDIEESITAVNMRIVDADEMVEIIVQTPAVKTLMIEELSDGAGKTVPEYIEGYTVEVKKNNQ